MASLQARTWRTLAVPTHHVSRLSKKFAFAQPTRVQSLALDALMPRASGALAVRGPPDRVAVIRWPTGSGKTLAFALPMLARLDMQMCGKGLQALVLTPTRE